MIEAICSVVAALIGLIVLVVELYRESSPERKADKREEEILQGRQDIVDGDADAVQRRLDQLLRDDADIRCHAGSEDRKD